MASPSTLCVTDDGLDLVPLHEVENSDMYRESGLNDQNARSWEFPNETFRSNFYSTASGETIQDICEKLGLDNVELLARNNINACGNMTTVELQQGTLLWVGTALVTTNVLKVILHAYNKYFQRI